MRTIANDFDRWGGHAYNLVDSELKARFHRVVSKRLREIAAHLGLTRERYEVRSNKGGIAVSGEITLHAETFYLQVCTGVMGGPQILLRTCKGRKDYSGGPNGWLPFSLLDDPAALVEKINTLVHGPTL